LKEQKLFIREPRHPTPRNGVSHHQGVSNSAFIDSDCKENDKKNQYDAAAASLIQKLVPPFIDMSH